MHVHTDDSLFSRRMLVAVGVLLAAVLVLVTLSRLTGIGVAAMPEGSLAQARELRFLDQPDGSVRVMTTDAQTVAVLEPGTNGFARSVMRGFARERKRSGIGDGPAFRLVRWSDGRLDLVDPATGRHVGLEAFGPTNVAVFARLLEGGAPS